MAKHTSLTQLMLAQEKRWQRTVISHKAAHTELSREGLKDLKELNSGTISTATLRAMGHPFGRIGGPGSNTGGRGVQKRVGGKRKVRAFPINKQTGQVYNRIRLDGPSGTKRTYRLYSSAAHAQFVMRPGGTKRMIDRGVLGPLGQLRKRHKARIKGIVNVVRARQRR